MEAAFGYDFSSLDVTLADRGLSAHGALAASEPERVRFASDQPDKGVVAHELVHIVQFRNAALAAGPTASGVTAEGEARRAARPAAQGRPVKIDGRSRERRLFLRPNELAAVEGADIDRWASDLRDRTRGQPDPMSVLHDEIANARGLPAVEQAVLVGIVSEVLGPAEAQRFAAAVGESAAPHPYERTMELDRTTVGGRGPGMVLPGLAGAAGATADRALALVEGFLAELPNQLDSETLRLAQAQLGRAALVGAAVPPVLLAGALHGAAADLADTLRMIANIAEVLSAMDQMVREILGPRGTEVASALGRDLAIQQGKEARELIGKTPAAAAYWIGYKLGPLLSDLLLAVITGGIAVVAVNTYRVGKTALEGLDALGALNRRWRGSARRTPGAGPVVRRLDAADLPPSMGRGDVAIRFDAGGRVDDVLVGPDVTDDVNIRVHLDLAQELESWLGRLKLWISGIADRLENSRLTPQQRINARVELEKHKRLYDAYLADLHAGPLSRQEAEAVLAKVQHAEAWKQHWSAVLRGDQVPDAVDPSLVFARRQRPVPRGADFDRLIDQLRPDLREHRASIQAYYGAKKTSGYTIDQLAEHFQLGGTETQLMRGNLQTAPRHQTSSRDFLRLSADEMIVQEPTVHTSTLLKDARGGDIGELDVVIGREGILIEDKSAAGVYRRHPRTGQPVQTPQEWSRKQIREKVANKLDAIGQAVGTAPRTGRIRGTLDVPTLAEVKRLDRVVVRVESADTAVQAAVNADIAYLQRQYQGQFQIEVLFDVKNIERLQRP